MTNHSSRDDNDHRGNTGIPAAQGAAPRAGFLGRARFVVSAVAFEASLGLLAVLLSFVGGVPLAEWRLWDPGSLLTATGVGLAATVPLFAALVAFQRHTPRPLHPIREVLSRHVVPLFRQLSIGELALLSAAAGIGEELLFRGLLQHGLAAWIGGVPGTICGLVLASLAFGACHWLNTAYAVVTVVVGVYLGLLLVISGQLLVPIVAHGLYDFLALIYLTRGPWPNARERE